MQPDRLKTIEEAFHGALQRPQDERSAYLDEVCANDPGLRREVESLLAETEKIDDFMDRPPAGSLASLELDEQESLEGRVLNHYRIGPLIGSGGMAEVYRAHDTRLKRDVAVKVLRHVQLLDRERRDGMYREARLLATLNHPNVESIHGIEEADGLCGLVLEFIEGETLTERIGRGSLPIQEAVRVAKQIAAGLQAAHAKGITHRDLKPSNIKITPDGTVKIVDFGIAKLFHSLGDRNVSTDFSSLGVVIGTPAYMSPEQSRGKLTDIRTDIWAFGCVLYETLAGRPAFEGDTPTDIVVKISTEQPDWSRIPRSPETVSVDLDRLIRKCMQKDPEFRYQSVREIATDLEKINQDIQGYQRYPGRPPNPINDADFVLPGRSAPFLFMLAQAGYMAIYAAAMYHIDRIAQILEADFRIPERAAIVGTMVLAMCGIATRLYLISAVGWRHPAAGRKFTLLFPLLLVLDSIWAASPLLLWRRIGYGLALTGVAMLAYVPFAQRTLMRTIYPKRTSSV